VQLDVVGVPPGGPRRLHPEFVLEAKYVELKTARRAADAVRARAEGCGQDSVSVGPSGRARPLDALLC
jgi:hypothetical protein